MKMISGALMVAGLALPLLVGCGPDEDYYRAPAQPPPPYAGNYHSDLVRMARQNGFRDGYADGAHDQHTGHSYKPTRDDKYEDCPGYYDELGPRDEYKNIYRDAYEHGYRRGFERG